MLRHHVNHDNDAPRLIAEEVLPILKIDLTYDEVRRLDDTLSDLDKDEDIGEAAETLEEIADDFANEDSPITSAEVIRRIRAVVSTLRPL